MSPPDSPLGPRVHMLLKVDLPEGPYLADVGFGACVLDAPLRLETGVEQGTPMGVYRLNEADGLYALSAKRGATWRTMYVFNLEPQLPADYALSNWFTSTSPEAPFVSRLIMERVAGGARHKLIDRRYLIEARDGDVVAERPLDSANDLGRVLDETFNVTPPAPMEEARAKWEPVTSLDGFVAPERGRRLAREWAQDRSRLPISVVSARRRRSADRASRRLRPLRRRPASAIRWPCRSSPPSPLAARRASAAAAPCAAKSTTCPRSTSRRAFGAGTANPASAAPFTPPGRPIAASSSVFG